MNFEIIVIAPFEREAKLLMKKYQSLKSDLQKLTYTLIENPIQGKALGKDCYKIRMAIESKGKGKSGGARVIICVKVIKNKVYLLTVYDKSEKEDISDIILCELLKFVE